MALNLVFIGYNEEQTRRYFKEFIESNKDQVQDYPLTRNTATSWICPTAVWLTDGTWIRRVPSEIARLAGLRFDQIIVACDRRGVWNWPDERLELLQHLYRNAQRRQVLEEDTVLIYEIDAGGEDRI